MNKYIVTSVVLGKRWLVEASCPEAAAGLIVVHCQSLLRELEAQNDGANVDVDLSVNHVTESVFEL